MHCNTNKNYFTDPMGILHKKVIDFNSTFSSVFIPKYALNTYYMLLMISLVMLEPWNYKLSQKALLLPRHAEDNTQIH